MTTTIPIKGFSPDVELEIAWKIAKARIDLCVSKLKMAQIKGNQDKINRLTKEKIKLSNEFKIISCKLADYYV